MLWLSHIVCLPCLQILLHSLLVQWSAFVSIAMHWADSQSVLALSTNSSELLWSSLQYIGMHTHIHKVCLPVYKCTFHDWLGSKMQPATLEWIEDKVTNGKLGRNTNSRTFGEKYKYRKIWGQKYWDKSSLTVKTNAISVLNTIYWWNT